MAGFQIKSFKIWQKHSIFLSLKLIISTVNLGELNSLVAIKFTGISISNFKADKCKCM